MARLPRHPRSAPRPNLTRRHYCSARGSGTRGGSAPAVPARPSGPRTHARRRQQTRRRLREAGQPAKAAAEFERVAASAEEPDLRPAYGALAGRRIAASADDEAAAGRMFADYVERFPTPSRLRSTRARRSRISPGTRMTPMPASTGLTTGRCGSQLRDRAHGPHSIPGGGCLARTRSAAGCDSARHPARAAAREIIRGEAQGARVSARRICRAEEYGVAQVTTAAAYAMADLYRELGRALLDSDRPQGLDDEELEQYGLLLEEQAFPFEEKAIGLHERNARLAAQGIYDEWVRSSFADLAQLKPGRYARAERAGAEADMPAARVVTRDPTPLPRQTANAASCNAATATSRRFCRVRAGARARPDYADAERNLAILLDLYLDDRPRPCRTTNATRRSRRARTRRSCMARGTQVTACRRHAPRRRSHDAHPASPLLAGWH